MKKAVLLCMLMPFLAQTQTKNVLSALRVFPKVDKVLEFEKALATHAQKYHKGDWSWRVLEIQTGPDANGYQLNEGPTDWDAIDKRGNLGDEHNKHWNKSVAIYLTDRSSNKFVVFQDSLSTVALGSYSDKIAITHWEPKVGWGGKVNDLLKQLRKVWQDSGENIAVWVSSGSGPAEFSIVTRYKDGLKERATGFRKPIKERYEAMNGADSFDSLMETLRQYVDKAWSELLFYRADLSSK